MPAAENNHLAPGSLRSSISADAATGVSLSSTPVSDPAVNEQVLAELQKLRAAEEARAATGARKRRTIIGLMVVGLLDACASSSSRWPKQPMIRVRAARLRRPLGITRVAWGLSKSERNGSSARSTDRRTTPRRADASVGRVRRPWTPGRGLSRHGAAPLFEPDFHDHGSPGDDLPRETVSDPWDEGFRSFFTKHNVVEEVMQFHV